MNRKIMALAVAGALAAPAVAIAQASNVSIYGSVNLGIDQWQAKGSAIAGGDYKARTRVWDNGSRIGFRGVEDLGGGLQAVFLIESGANVDNGGTTGQGGNANTTSGTLGSRNGHVGLQGSWGLLTFGKSNVFWGNGPHDQVGAKWIENSPGTSTGSFGRGMGVGVTRQSNTVQYTSPVMSGVNAQISYSPNLQEAQAAGQNADGKLWGITVNGAWGPISAGWDWVKNSANTPAAGGAQGATTGNKLRAGWDYGLSRSLHSNVGLYAGAQRVSVIVIQSKLDNGGASPNPLDPGSASLKQTGWVLNWEHKFNGSNFMLVAQYAKQNNISGCQTAGRCDNTNMTGYAAGVLYFLSNRTWMFANVVQINNGSNYNQDFVGGSMTSGTGQVPAGIGLNSLGADPREVGVGIMHYF
jgi:predicted porin